MPIVKFDTPQNHADNKGSCEKFLNYLEKEDKDKGIDKEFFFNQNSKYILNYDVKSAIDNNRKSLGKDDAKFYTGSINLSEDELKYLKNDFKKIKEYTIEVMKEYAQNFNKGLDINNINWYAKIESNRYYKGDDPEVKSCKVKQGETKPGLNTHVHFIVGRKSVDGKMKLSPVTNHKETSKGPIKGGFNRDIFKEKSERVFDIMFKYNRPLDSTYEFNKIKKGNDIDKKFQALDSTSKQKALNSSYNSLTTEQKEKRLSSLIYYIQFKASPDKNVLDKVKLMNAERDYAYDGSIYKSLINLNWRIQNNRIPNETDLTDFILLNAEHLNQTSDHEKPVIDSISEPLSNALEIVEGIADMLTSSASFPNIFPLHEQNRYFDEMEFRKKKKRKGRNNDLSI
jgi:hypothetical protein